MVQFTKQGMHLLIAVSIAAWPMAVTWSQVNLLAIYLKKSKAEVKLSRECQLCSYREKHHYCDRDNTCKID